MAQHRKEQEERKKKALEAMGVDSNDIEEVNEEKRPIPHSGPSTSSNLNATPRLAIRLLLPRRAVCRSQCYLSVQNGINS